MTMNITAALFVVTLCATPLFALGPGSGANLGSVRGGDFRAAHAVIKKRCTGCHSDKLIDAALSAGKNMSFIQQEMEKKGAKLNTNERDVLGIYWKRQNPLKK